MMMQAITCPARASGFSRLSGVRLIPAIVTLRIPQSVIARLEGGNGAETSL
jgi:hypothetical protein